MRAAPGERPIAFAVLSHPWVVGCGEGDSEGVGGVQRDALPQTVGRMPRGCSAAALMAIKCTRRSSA